MNRSPVSTANVFFSVVLLASALTASASAQTSPPPPPRPVDTAAGAQPPPGDAPAAAPTPASAPAASAEPEPSASPSPATEPAGEEVTDWTLRDRDVRESNSINGGTGLLHMQHAESGAPGQFRIGFVTEWFSAGFLCTPQFPCPALQPGGPLITSDTMNHAGGTLSVSASIAKLGPGILEGYGSTSAVANSDSANRPAILQVLGDTNLGVKYAAPVGDILHLGLFSELWLINSSGSLGLDGSGTSAKFGGIATGDLRGMPDHVPLRFSANLVYSVDNTADVLAQTEAQRGAQAGLISTTGMPLPQPVTRIERYGLGVNRVDHVDIMIGAEGLLAEERVRPFVEARILIPSNRQGYQCQVDPVTGSPTNPSHDQCLSNDHDAPSTLTIGGRFFPWKRGLSLLAALDIGMTGVANFIEELSPVPPWTLYIGAGWAVDTWDRPPVVKTVEKVVEHGRPNVLVVGFVHERDKNDPVAGATLSYHGHSDLWPIATGPDGKFGDDVAPAKYTYDIEAEGYKPGTCEVDANKPSGQVDVDCPLDALPRTGVIVGHARDGESNRPVVGVQVVVTDAVRKELRLSTDASGGFRFEGVAAGNAELSVIADGYLALVAPAEVKARQEATVDLFLRPKPKQSMVQVTGKEITIKDQIQFALDSAVILPQSFGLLTEVADTIIRHPEIRRIEVQGHTDNSGTPEHNRGLSEERAEAVRAWLVQHGVLSDRLVARGYGQDNPLVPNVTAANRARNRRVQFIILDRSDAGPAALEAPRPGPAAAPPAPPAPRKLNPLPGF